MSIYEKAKLLEGTYSPEAIKSHVGRMHPLAKEMVEYIQKYKDAREETNSRKNIKALNDAFSEDICKMVKHHINMTIDDYEVVESAKDNAWAYIPDMDKNNPVIKTWINWMDGQDSLKMLRKLKTDPIGWCDKDKVRLGGIYADIPCRMGIYTGILKNYSAGAAAFIICHEIGHIWSGFEFLVSSITRNVTLAAACEDAKNKWDVIDKAELVKCMANLEDFEDFNLKEASESKQKMEELFIVTISQNVKNTTNELKSVLYDETVAESYADQLSSRLGLAIFSTESIGKLYIQNGMAAKRSKGVAFLLASMQEVLQSAFMSGGLIMMIGATGPLALVIGAVGVCLTMFLICRGNESFIYDKFNDRMLRIRNELVNGVKNAQSPVERKQLLEEIDRVNDMVKTHAGTTMNKGILSVLTIFLIPYLRNNANARELQQSYERLINNSLYVSAARLTDLTA